MSLWIIVMLRILPGNLCVTHTQLQHLVWKMASAQFGLVLDAVFWSRTYVAFSLLTMGMRQPNHAANTAQTYTSITCKQALTFPWKGQCSLLTRALILVFTGAQCPSQVCPCSSQQDVWRLNVSFPREDLTSLSQEPATWEHGKRKKQPAQGPTK